MTIDEVQELVRLQSSDNLALTNGHGTSLHQALITPQKITVIVRSIQHRCVIEEREDVWLVGQENESDGYRIVMRKDVQQFGLASKGFPADKFLILDGWYGDLKSAFLAM